jgi:hypothetical protein
MNPLLGYNLDSDCVAYLTIAERVAHGDYFNSINGLWSPLNSWILALFIKNGFDAWSTAKCLNALFGAIILIQSFFLFLKFKINKHLVVYLQTVLSIVMVYFVYFQMFGDVLQIMLVLCYLWILWHKDSHPMSYKQAVFSGLIMGIAFYAKAYSFFFFALHFLATLAWHSNQLDLKWKKGLSLYGVGLLTAIVVMMPWSWMLHKKYNEWSLNGHAGKLNMSWYINSGKSFNTNIGLLIPPSYDDSPSFWEDPYLSQSNLSTPFTSATHFVKWIFRIVHTTIIMIFCFQEISFLGLSLLLFGLFYFFFRKEKNENVIENFQMQCLLITIIILPLGYLMMHIETRYIWLAVILLMILGAYLIDKLANLYANKYIQHALYGILAISFLVFPLYQFENLKDKNKDLFEFADVLNKNHIKGKFTSNMSDAGRMWVVAYLTKSNFYTIEQSGFTQEALLNEMKKYQVRYYFFESENNTSTLQMEGMKSIFKYNNIEILELL